MVYHTAIQPQNYTEQMAFKGTVFPTFPCMIVEMGGKQQRLLSQHLYPYIWHVKTCILSLCLFTLCSHSLKGQVSTSVNVTGNRFESLNDMHAREISPGTFVILGTDRNLSIKKMRFDRGEIESLRILQRVGNEQKPILGAGGWMLNDSQCILIGQVPNALEEDKVLVLKADLHGALHWGKTFIQDSVNHADQVFPLTNQRFMVSMKRRMYEDSEGLERYGSAIAMMDTSGQLLWYKELDSRNEPDSRVIFCHENPLGDIVLLIRYSEKLLWIKMDAQGSHIDSKISTDDLHPIHATYDPLEEQYFLLGHHHLLVVLNHQLEVLQARSLSGQGLHSFRSIALLQQDLLLGCSRNNQSAIIKVNKPQLQIQQVYSQQQSGYATTFIHSLIPVNAQQLVSISSPGFSVQLHDAQISGRCYQADNIGGLGSQAVNISAFTKADSVGGVGQIAPLGSLLIRQEPQWFPSSNCLSYDMSIKTEQVQYLNSCRNVRFNWYVYNHGNEDINRFDISYYFDDQRFSQTFQVDPIPPKTGRFVEYGEAYLHPGMNRVSYRISMPNGQADLFPFNDSFYTDYFATGSVPISFAIPDSICEDTPKPVTIIGPDGTYALFKDDRLLEQSQNRFFNALGGGKYYVRYTSVLGCFSFSDTVQVVEIPNPPIPALWLQNDTFYTDATPPFYWIYNQQITDSNTTFFVYVGPGNYRVESYNDLGCSSSNTLSNIVLTNPVMTESLKPHLRLTAQSIQWAGITPVSLHIYGMEGRLYWKGTLQAGGNDALSLTAGVYIVKIETEHLRQHFKIAIGPNP